MLFISINDYINFENNTAFIITAVAIIVLFIITMVFLSMAKNKRKKKEIPILASDDRVAADDPMEMDFQDDSSLIIKGLDWESDQAMFILPEELMEKEEGYREAPEVDLFAKVTGYSFDEFEEDQNLRGPIREYEPKQESDTISIIMTPIKAQYIKRTREKVKSGPERLESSFAKDYIYDPTTSTMEGQIVIIQDSQDKYRFRLKTSNGITVGYSQGYNKIRTAKDVIKEITLTADRAEISDNTTADYLPVIGRPVFEIYEDLDGKFRYKLLSASGQILLASQGFFKKSNCVAAVQAIRDISILHKFMDLTSSKVSISEQPYIEPIAITEI